MAAEALQKSADKYGIAIKIETNGAGGVENELTPADIAEADGIIVASNKFCEYWSYERTIDTIVLPRDFGYPVCSIEKEYINSASGQLRTRFQAFVESIEIKKIQEGK